LQAAELTEEFEEGVYFVPLAAIIAIWSS